MPSLGGVTPVALDRLLVALPAASRIASIVRARIEPSSASIHPATLRLLSRVLVMGTPTADARQMNARDEIVFDACETAFIEHRALLLDYVDAQGRASDRIVEAHGLALRASGWSVLAIDRASGQPRAFRIDRVRRARLLTERFSPLDPRTFT